MRVIRKEIRLIRNIVSVGRYSPVSGAPAAYITNATSQIPKCGHFQNTARCITTDVLPLGYSSLKHTHYGSAVAVTTRLKSGLGAYALSEQK